MARKPRIEFEGAFYHVITRGNQRQPVFKERKDYERYLSILSNYKVRYDFSLYAYALMSNHVHLLIEVKTIPLSRVLQGINQSYTMYFNRKYRTVGHLFQGRYKAILCDKDKYLLSLVKYIHLNPVRAEIVKDPGLYPWSSHGSYVGRIRGKGMVEAELVLKMFWEDLVRARRDYRHYMGEKEEVKREDIYATVDQRILGDERFVKEVMGKTGRRELWGRRRHEYTLQEIAEVVAEIWGVTVKQLREKRRDEGIQTARRVTSLVAKQYGYRGKEIGECLRRDPAVITRYLKEEMRFEAEIQQVHERLKKQSQCQ